MKRMLKWSGVGGVALGAAWLVLQMLPPRGVVPEPNSWRPRAGQRPLVIAHAGGQGLRPSNTLAAFAHSAGLGCDVLEMDLRLTRDGVLVVIHDETIDRTSDGQGRVIDFTVGELKQRNFGYKFKDQAGARPYRDQPVPIPTLEEVFTRFPQMPMVVELKDRTANGAKAATVLTELIRRFDREARTMVAAFDDATLDEFRRVSAGRVFTASPMERTRRFVLYNRAWLDWLAPTVDQALQIPVAAAGFQLDTPHLLSAAHRRNLAVHYWTVNDPTEMKRLIALGADGLMTDYPDRLLAVLKEIGR